MKTLRLCSSLPRTLDQHIAQLRKKAEIQPEIPEFIQTALGAGSRDSG